jgi:hypothetical protein
MKTNKPTQSLKAPKPEPKKVKEEKIDKSKIEGLQQTFTLADGKTATLHSVLTDKDFWQTNGRVKRVILTHDAVKKIADLAGVAKSVQYQILTQPDAYNNYQYTIQASVCMIKDKDNCANEIGEANRSNLGTKGRGNPANMAQKRAYDRAVFRLLGITGMLSEEELTDNEIEEVMDGLTHDDKKKIAPVVNQLLLATTKDHFILFNRMMKEKAKDFNDACLDYLRKLYKKRLAETQKTSF